MQSRSVFCIQLNHPEFQSLDIHQLQSIVATDKKYRFDLEFDPTKGNDLYWIRAKQWNVCLLFECRLKIFFTLCR
jgi:RNA:NAD 2'-phosphotransferase (TPT1/KptA family)